MPIFVRRRFACSASSRAGPRPALTLRAGTSTRPARSRRRELFGGHPDRDRVVHVAVGEPLDRGRDGGREQRRLTARGPDPQDALDVLDEAEVEHLVRLVEHHIASDARSSDPREIRSSVRPTVATTTCAPAQPRLLRLHRLAAEHRDHLDRQVLGVGAQRLGHLDAQLAGRGEHERLGSSTPDRGTGASAARRPRSSGAGLRLADHVPAREQLRIACSWIGVGSS